MSLNNKIDEIRNKYNKISESTYKILMCKFATSCSKGKKCNYCHKGEKQNKTRKVKFYEYIIKNKLLDHIKKKIPYVKIICDHCDKNLKSLEYVNKQQLRFREKIAMFCNYKDIDWIVDFTEEYFRRRVVCYRHIKSFYDDSVVCTGGINCCFGNHDLAYKNEYKRDKKDTINKFIKSVIEKLSSDLKKYADIISKDLLENKEKEKIFDYISELKKSILEYSNWINNSNHNNVNCTPSIRRTSRSTSSKDNEVSISHYQSILRNLNFDSDNEILSESNSDTNSSYESSEEDPASSKDNEVSILHYQSILRNLNFDSDNEIVSESDSDTNSSYESSEEDPSSSIKSAATKDNIYTERSKSVINSTQPTRIIRKSKSFSCPKDLLQSNDYNAHKNDFMTNIDDSITHILAGSLDDNYSFQESTDFFEEDFYSIDRSLISPATANWIHDFRKSKTPESRHISSSPYCDALNADFMELHHVN